MKSRRYVVILAALGLLVIRLSTLTAQVHVFDCGILDEFARSDTGWSFDEHAWYEINCVAEKEDDDDDDDEIVTELVYMMGDLPAIMSCATLPPSVTVYGYNDSTQCQIVDGAGIGNGDLIERGIISAVDIWGFVNGGVEACFRNAGSLVFLDADYAPRMLMELTSFERDGMTCAAIDGAGTVALVRSGLPSATAALPAEATPPPPGEPTLPTFDAIPLSDCQIKLQETLFLRAQPAGEIIGLVWQFSEVPAFEINGYWYKIEFEGQTGYISRYHRKVLRGGCG